MDCTCAPPQPLEELLDLLENAPEDVAYAPEDRERLLAAKQRIEDIAVLHNWPGVLAGPDG
jgi:hypothetical protein